MEKKILITGASGLLGQALVNQFSACGFSVLGQYHAREPETVKNCTWLYGDFTELSGIREFLSANHQLIKSSRHLINNYGPITYCDISKLTSEDFVNDFFSNVVTAFEISDYCLKKCNLRSVTNIGFEFNGQVKPYQKVLTYAIAKSGLLLLTESLKKKYRQVQFNLVSPGNLTGAKVTYKDRKSIPPKILAARIIDLVTGEGQS